MDLAFFVFALVVLAKLSAHAHPASDIKFNEEWPEKCKGKNYCGEETDTYISLKSKFEQLLKGESLDYIVGNETGDRDSEDNDVGFCRSKITFKPITMIRDENNLIWYVPQTANYTVKIQINECSKNGGHVTSYNSTLDQRQLKRYKVHCVEQRFNLRFPVLSQDRTRLEPQSLTPYKGLPMSCSAKIIK